jgi:hypothetical protein
VGGVVRWEVGLQDELYKFINLIFKLSLNECKIGIKFAIFVKYIVKNPHLNLVI